MRRAMLAVLLACISILHDRTLALSRRFISMRHPFAASSALALKRRRSTVKVASDRFVDLGLRYGTGLDVREFAVRGKGIGYYTGMRDDLERTGIYRRAINALAKGKVIVDVGTGGLALLAILCAKAGAKHVYAIEGSPKVAASARKTVEEAGLTQTITVINDFSTSLNELPQPVDLIVHEVLGNIASSEGVSVIIEDAKRFLKPVSLRTSRPWSIPARAETLVAPIINKKFFADIPPNLKTPWRTCKTVPDHVLLGDWQPCEDLVFGGPKWNDAEWPMPSGQDMIVAWKMERKDVFAGFAFCIRVSSLPGDAPITSLPAESSWDKLVVLFDEREVIPGDTLSLRVTSHLSDIKPLYDYHAILVPASASQGPLPTLEDFDAFQPPDDFDDEAD